MAKLTAEEYLRRYEGLQHIIHNIELEIEDMMVDAIPVRSTTDYDGMPHGHNIGDPTADIAIQLSDKINARRLTLVERKLKAYELRQEIFDTIISLNGVEQDALYAKYILLYNEEQICDYIHYERSMMYEYLRRGINKVQELIDSGQLRT